MIQSLDVKQGGIVSVLQGLARAQAFAGHRVTVYTTEDYVGKPNHDSVQEISGVAVDSFPISFRPLLFSHALYRRLRNDLSKFDILHIHGLYRFPVTCAALRARKARVPYIIMPHGSLDPFLYKQSYYGKWALPLKRLYERLFDIPNLNHASAILYTAKEEAERAAFLGLHAPAVIVPNGIDWELYAELPDRGLFRRSISLEGKNPLVLFLGRVNFKKGLDLLVPSFARVLEKFPDTCLAVVGPDNEGYGLKVRQWCREQGIADKVIFVGHLDPEEVKQAYVDADVFVLPSYTENFGMTVVEAMACRCPVVISDQVNIWREIRDEEAGLVVGLNPMEIADAICQVLTNKATANEMGKRGRVAAEKRYAWPHIVDRMTDVYRRLIAEKANERRRVNK
ncbi:MAG: glycosyltransferase [Syntrophaceae bacterium]|nr:glycosyltransferase [Syntrophaceae bacterium]